MNNEFENLNENGSEETQNQETPQVESEDVVLESVEIAEEAEKTDSEPDIPKKKGWKRELLEWIESLAISVVVALLIVNFVFTLVNVSGASMEPTLQNKDVLFVFRLGYQPDNGDIVVFKPKGDPDRYYIKRVIATEGQEIDISNGDVYIDGELLEEDYIKGITKLYSNTPYPQTVPEDHVFVLGDNRENSKDSRDSITVGMVDEDLIAGRAIFRLFPFNKFGILK